MPTPRPAAVVPETFITFGELLKYLRRRAGLTQRELSIAVSYSESLISRLEQNERVPDSATVAARFVPALQLDREPEWAARLLKLAGAGERATSQPTVANLPLLPTSFIGREHELEMARQILDRERLLTLTGPGGTGKTRLALQVAHQRESEFAEGVWLAEFARLAEPALVPQIVAATLGLRAEGDRPIVETLGDALWGKAGLLILDNCEHVIDACAQLAAALLTACPTMRLLATSREPLNVPGEVVLRVPSLALPAAEAGEAVALLNQSEAVQLFVDRAAAVLPGFTLTAHNGRAVAEVCRRLDGIPLALELAAARASVLSVEQIAARLNDRFQLLTGGSRTALPRHQTLRAMMDWSYDLLPDAERILLRRLAVLAGSWGLEAAEAIGGWGGLERDRVLEALAQLVNKSLVVAEAHAGAEVRYRLLETVRHYAREKLTEAGESETTRQRHLDYFTQLAETAEPELMRANQLEWLRRLEADFDNVRAALEWAAEAGTAQGVACGLRLASAIWRYGLRLGFAGELAEKLLGLLSSPNFAARNVVRAKALGAASVLSVWQADLSRARSLAEQSLAISTNLDDEPTRAAALYMLGTVAQMQADPAWQTYFAESLALYRQLHDTPGISEVLILWGSDLEGHDPPQARAYLEEALVLCRQRGDAITMAGALDNLGELAMGQGELAEARRLLEESLMVQRPLGELGLVNTLHLISELAFREGNFTEARALTEQVLALSQRTGLHTLVTWSWVDLGQINLREDRLPEAHANFTHALIEFERAGRMFGVNHAIEGLARLATTVGQYERATQLHAWATRARHRSNDQRWPVQQVDVDGDLAVCRAQLNATAFDEAWASGEAMDLPTALALAQSPL